MMDRRRSFRASSFTSICFIEQLETRQLLSFSAWSSIGPAIAKVPMSAGQLANASVVNFNTTVYTGPLNVTNTLSRIRADNGPDRSDDGSVYTNPQASGLPVDGTYYEFTIDPATGTDHDFTTISFPGPMRILLATGGDCYFTGDHYSTFQPVFIFGTATPVIGSFAMNPTSVVTGASSTLTATGVTESGGTISGVSFYRETNGTSGLQIGSDTLVGSGAASGTTYTLSTSTTGFAAGTYTYYAVAKDTGGNSSATSSAALTVTAVVTPNPVIGSFTDSPTSVIVGASTTLTASSVTDAGSTITAVKFYRESNGTAGLQTTGDTLVGAGAQSGTTWTISASTTGLTAGTYTYYAVATDAAGVSSAASSTALTVTNQTTSGTLLGWSVTGQTAFGTQGLAASTIASGVTNSTGLTRGSGVSTSGTAASGAWGGAGFSTTTSTAGISAAEFVTFGLTVSAGSTASLSTVTMNYRRSASGPANGFWDYQIGTGAFITIGTFASEFSSTSSSGSTITPLSLTSIAALQNLVAGTKVTLRLTPYGATSSGGTFYVYDEAGDDLDVTGSTGSTGAVVRAAMPFATSNAIAFPTSTKDDAVVTQISLLE
jgi:hypothetical protein